MPPLHQVLEIRGMNFPVFCQSVSNSAAGIAHKVCWCTSSGSSEEPQKYPDVNSFDKMAL